MLTGLPRLLGRGFLIGFVLPATLFLLALKTLDQAFQLNLLAIPKDTDVLGVVIFPFAIIFLGILLIAVNRPLIRLLEEYGRANPFKILLSRKVDKFNKEIKPVLDEKRRLDQVRKHDSGAQSKMPDFSKRLLEAVTNYPDEAEFVLATRFGNIMRAFEVYPRV
jgi:hypothetical protein